MAAPPWTDSPEYVTSYRLMFSFSGSHSDDFKTYRWNINGPQSVNDDKEISIDPPLTLKYLRILPRTWVTWPCLRMDVFGETAISEPTVSPTTSTPSTQPTLYPSNIPTNAPTRAPSVDPTNNPSNEPTIEPSNIPSYLPTFIPSLSPSMDPTLDPTTRTRTIEI